MKKLILAFALTIVLLSCRQEKIAMNDNATVFKQQLIDAQNSAVLRTEEYQTLSPRVQFLKNPSTGIYDVESQNIFIRSSGLPLSGEFYSWSNSHSVTEAINLYKDFSQLNRNNPFINVFRQYGGWMLLTHYNMLSSTKNSGSPADVKYLLESLISSNYHNYGLLYFAIKYLKENGTATKSEMQSWVSAIQTISSKEGLVKKPTILTEADFKNRLKPMSPEAIDIINKGLAQRAEKNVYLDQINGLLP